MLIFIGWYSQSLKLLSNSSKIERACNEEFPRNNMYFCFERFAQTYLFVSYEDFAKLSLYCTAGLIYIGYGMVCWSHIGDRVRSSQHKHRAPNNHPQCPTTIILQTFFTDNRELLHKNKHKPKTNHIHKAPTPPFPNIPQLLKSTNNVPHSDMRTKRTFANLTVQAIIIDPVSVLGCRLVTTGSCGKRTVAWLPYSGNVA